MMRGLKRTDALNFLPQIHNLALFFRRTSIGALAAVLLVACGGAGSSYVPPSREEDQSVILEVLKVAITDGASGAEPEPMRLSALKSNCFHMSGALASWLSNAGGAMVKLIFSLCICPRNKGGSSG